jgi:hypothetical protein
MTHSLIGKYRKELPKMKDGKRLGKVTNPFYQGAAGEGV